MVINSTYAIINSQTDTVSRRQTATTQWWQINKGR